MGPERTEIPAHLLANWTEWSLGDAVALAAEVRLRCAAAVTAWGLTHLRPLHGGEVAFVLAARRGQEEVVLKLSPSGGADPSEARALGLWAARGLAPRMLGVRDAGATVLLTRVRPGGTLGDSGAGAAEVLATIGALCARLHLPVEELAGGGAAGGRGAAGGGAAGGGAAGGVGARDADGACGGVAAGFPALRDHARDDGWLSALDGTRERDELMTLLAPSHADRLLHVDLHALNVLRGDGAWLVIDPKPRIGDPGADVYGFLDGAPLRELPRAASAARAWVRARLQDYGRAAGEDPARLHVWLRIRTQILLVQGPGPKRESLLRLREALG